ncbi:Vam6/Vps39-like protein [Acrasis kona]|uniref:Vam6/Vps39-like protein n=1 Tax=Acrasis kona TaxID=1008807 RepID=A0AAW2Z1H0_9EUKA
MFDIMDPDLAIEYCDSVYLQDYRRSNDDKAYLSSYASSDANYNPYLVTLVEICVKPTKTRSPELMQYSSSFMKNLLDSRSSDIDPIEVLRALPDDVNASALEGFLEQSIQFTHHRERTSKIKDRLSRNANMQVKAKHLKATTRKVEVYAHTVCPVCDQTIENAVFAVFPDMSIVHYRCLTSANNKRDKMMKSTSVHPKTLLNFDRFPVDF